MCDYRGWSRGTGQSLVNAWVVFTSWFRLHWPQLCTWTAFWESSRSCLSEGGYTFSEYGHNWGNECFGPEVTCWIPKLNSASNANVEYSFTRYGGDVGNMPALPLSAWVQVPLIHSLTLMNAHWLRATHGDPPRFCGSPCRIGIDQEKFWRVQNCASLNSGI